MIYIGIMGCSLILFFNWIRLKDIVAPPFILSAIWLVMYVILFFRRDTVDLSSVYYCSFLIGLYIFNMGFFFIVKNRNKKKCDVKEYRKSNIKFNPVLIKVIFLIEIIIFLLLLINISTYISSNFIFNVWQSLSIGRRTGMYHEGMLIEYARNAIISFSIVCSVVYFSNPNKVNRKYFLFTLLIGLFITVTGGNRGVIFLLLLAVFFSNIIIKNYRNKKIAVILGVLVVIILIIFIGSAFLKYVYADTSNTFEFIMTQMRVYFSSSLVAFVEWIKTFNGDYSYGTNTFRFIAAILNSLGVNINVTDVIQDFIAVYGDQTNVYTILQYYANDFGLIYAFIIQLLLGMTYGILYKKAVLTKINNPFFIALLSILYYPLIYQFFSDQYFSIVSVWIQVIFWFWLFTRKGLLITTTPNGEAGSKKGLR